MPRERSAGWSRGGNGGTVCALTPCSSVWAGEESGATSRAPPNVEMRLWLFERAADW